MKHALVAPAAHGSGARERSLMLRDVASPFLILGVGLGGWFIVSLIIVAIEVALLMALRWAPLRTTLRDVFVANLLSTLVGLTLFCVSLVAFSRINPIWLLLAFLLTLFIEGLYLLRLKRHPPARTMRAVIAMNVATYALLAFLFLRGLG